jgi:hypothetical protein
MGKVVIANAVKQSMQSEVMDRHASLAMTGMGHMGFGTNSIDMASSL